MTFGEARDFVKETAKSGSILGLGTMRRLMEELGNPQELLTIVHIAGTNGKGSTGAYLASICAEAGLHVGRYISPAVFDPLEVWQYDGEPISETAYADVMAKVKGACDALVAKGQAHPTVFEVETAASFCYFAGKKPDVVLLETGMGGSTDATNIIAAPEASVITTISMDHMQFLGDAIEEIAEVKAGIIKRNRPVFSAPQEAGVAKVLRKAAERAKAPILFASEDTVRIHSQKPGFLEFSYTSASNTEYLLTTAMAGSCQTRNAALAVEVAEYLLPRFCGKGLPVADFCRASCIRQGIARARWSGRFELLGEDPVFLLDGAHNEDAADCLAKTVQNCFTNTKLIYIIGVLADKEHQKMLERMLPYADTVYTVTPDNPRALDGRALADEAVRLGGRAFFAGSVEEAAELAVEEARRRGEPVLCFGSLSYLGRMRAAWKTVCGREEDDR